MTRPSARRRLAYGAAFAALALGLGGALVHRDRQSLEHGNRLYRGGRVDAAEEVYRGRADDAAASRRAAYNLGTALLALDVSDAERYLRVAAEEGDTPVRQRGYYNLAYHLLEDLDEATEPDSAVLLLSAAVGNNRAALRLDPGSEDARWNLALAQRMLDSVTQIVAVDEARPRQERPPSSDEEGGIVIPQVLRPGTRGIEREALAGEDSGALTEADALVLLDLVDPSVEPLIRGLIWSHRPAVDPWAEPYPGGNR